MKTQEKKTIELGRDIGYGYKEYVVSCHACEYWSTTRETSLERAEEGALKQHLKDVGHDCPGKLLVF